MDFLRLTVLYEEIYDPADVAQNAGVSVATVSHVINGTHYVSPELVVRVQGAIETLNYRPNKIARALNREDIPLLALIVPDISNPYWSSLARAVQGCHRSAGLLWSLSAAAYGLLDRETRFLRSLSGWVSGLILHPYHVTHAQVSQIMGRYLPIVILGDFVTPEETPANWDRVASNNQQSAQTAVEYLIGLGHRRIAFIQGTAGTPSSMKRLAGVRDAFRTAGLPLDEDLIVPGDYTRSGGQKAMAALLDRPEPPTAVFCANDLSALGALEEAKVRGWRIPQDLSIVGYDDIDEAALASPALTTIRLPPQVIGAVAAGKLIERLTGRLETSFTTIQGTLVIRELAAAPRNLG